MTKRFLSTPGPCPRTASALRLLVAALATAASAQPTPAGDGPTVWINEIHHTNAGPDTGEGVEIAGPAGTRLDGWRVWAYSGYGTLYAPDGSRSDDPLGPSVLLSGTLDDEGGGLGALWIPVRALRGGCQGLALTDPAGAAVQFLSTGGCQFNALSGPVHDAAQAATPGGAHPAHPDSLAWSTPIRGPRPSNGTHRRVQQWSTVPAGHSLQLSGAGRAYTDFAWAGPLPASPGRLNDYQAPTASANTASANTASGWAAGAPVPLGLLAPAVHTGLDHDAPAPPPRQPLAAALGEWIVSPPSPNPARTTTRLRVAAALGAPVEITVYDALGRAVLHQQIGSGRITAVLDASSLAPGLYVVRVAAGRQIATRRLTVAR